MALNVLILRTQPGPEAQQRREGGRRRQCVPRRNQPVHHQGIAGCPGKALGRVLYAARFAVTARARVCSARTRKRTADE